MNNLETKNGLGLNNVFSLNANSTSDEMSIVIDSAIPAPFKVIAQGFKKLLSSMKNFVKNPITLITSIALAVLWLVLNILKAAGVNSGVLNFISAITCANGGTYGGITSTIGGLAGKGVFACALMSIITSISQKKSQAKEMKNRASGLFKISKVEIFSLLIGMGTAMLLYVFLTGGAIRSCFMVGVAALYLTIKQNGNGFLSRLSASIFAKAKINSHPAVDNITKGFTFGFALAAALGLLRLNLTLIILGNLAVIAGVILAIVYKKNQAKGASINE